MRDIVIYYIYVIEAQVEKGVISCTSERYHVNL
jgi:hypothetical protein